MANTQKQTLVSDLIKILNDYPHFIVVGFEKTSHIALEKLRKELKKNGAKITVVKNTLFTKALNKFANEKKGQGIDTKALTAAKKSSAILALGEDWSAGLKAFYNYAKTEKTLVFKIGFLENKIYQVADIEQIAQLPSKGELVAKLIGTLKSPMYHTVYAMKFNMQQFVMVLSEASKKTK